MYKPHPLVKSYMEDVRTDLYGLNIHDCADAMASRLEKVESRNKALETALRNMKLGLSDCWSNIISGGHYDVATIVQNTIKQIDAAIVGT